MSAIMDHQFDTKVIRVKNAVAAGTGDNIDSDVIDTQGYDGVEFLVLFGAITATAVTTVKAQSGAASNLSDAADLTGASISVADDDDNQIARMQVTRPLKRYVRCRVTRATANAVIDGIVAVLFRAKKSKESEDATVCGADKVAGV